MSPDRWIPMEWPASWRDPALLSLLDGSPVNCLLLDSDAPSAIREGAAKKNLDCPAKIPWSATKEINWQSQDPLLAIKDAFWPDLARRAAAATNDAEAGPTGTPWLDANGWLIQLARTRVPQRIVWIKSDPPENADRLVTSNYQLALAEAWTYGAHRPIWLAPKQASALAESNASARQSWDQTMKTLAWLESHREWNKWRTYARMLVLSDYTGSNEYTANETLLLAARRNLAFLACETGKFTAANLQGMKALLYMDAQPLSPTAAAAVDAFMKAGGLVLALKQPAAAFKGRGAALEPNARFDVYSYGKGRLAVCKGEYDDPYLLAQDAHLLLSRRHDALRLFNAGTIQWYHTAAPDGRRWMVHLVNYSRYGSANQVSLQSWTKLKAARFHSPDAAEPKDLGIQRETGQSEVYLPRFAVHASVELELA